MNVTRMTLCRYRQPAYRILSIVWARPGRPATEPRTCRWTVGPIWKLGGETCVCQLPTGHDGPHECSCGSWFEGCGRPDAEPGDSE